MFKAPNPLFARKQTVCKPLHPPTCAGAALEDSYVQRGQTPAVMTVNELDQRRVVLVKAGDVSNAHNFTRLHLEGCCTTKQPLHTLAAAGRGRPM